MEDHYNFKDRTGERHKSKSCGWVTIVKYRGTFDCDILFEDTGHIIENLSYGNIKLGSVKNPYHPYIYGIGYFGEGKYISRDVNGEKTKAYRVWHDIFERCYAKNRSVKNRSYQDCNIHSDWHCFQNFATWHEKNYNPEIMEEWHLDKDIICKDCKMYSAKTCLILPAEINSTINRSGIKKGAYPIGVHLNKRAGTFIARVTKYGVRISLGSFKTVIEAFKAYKTAKEDYIKELADKWLNLLPKDSYDAVYKYKVEITD